MKCGGPDTGSVRNKPADARFRTEPVYEQSIRKSILFFRLPSALGRAHQVLVRMIFVPGSPRLIRHDYCYNITGRYMSRMPAGSFRMPRCGGVMKKVFSMSLSWLLVGLCTTVLAAPHNLFRPDPHSFVNRGGFHKFSPGSFVRPPVSGSSMPGRSPIKPAFLRTHPPLVRGQLSLRGQLPFPRAKISTDGPPASSGGE